MKNAHGGDVVAATSYKITKIVIDFLAKTLENLKVAIYKSSICNFVNISPPLWLGRVFEQTRAEPSLLVLCQVLPKISEANRSGGVRKLAKHMKI